MWRNNNKLISSGVRRNFSWGVSFCGIWWSFVFGVRCFWRHNLTSYSCFQAKFVDTIGIFFYTHSPYFCKNQALYTRLVIKFFQNIKLKGRVNLTPPLRTPLLIRSHSLYFSCEWEKNRVFTVFALQVMGWRHGTCNHFLAFSLHEDAFSFHL